MTDGVGKRVLGEAVVGCGQREGSRRWCVHRVWMVGW